jgi:hypothetical protein
MMQDRQPTKRTVIHPQLGPGQLLKTYMGGFEFEVQFESGRRFRLPAREFEPDSVTAWQSRATPAGNGITPRTAVLEVDQFRARQTLEALRLGIVPVQDVETLTIGLEAERVSLDRALARSMERGGDALAVMAITASARATSLSWRPAGRCARTAWPQSPAWIWSKRRPARLMRSTRHLFTASASPIAMRVAWLH